MRKYILTLFVASLSLYSEVVSAQTDSTYLFRFVPQKDMFFILFKDNEQELERLSLFIEQHGHEIAKGRLPLYVDGYCSSLSSEKENLAVARLRSNRVKSELILHQGVKEKCFITRNHAGGGDYVTVKVTLPTIIQEKAEITAAELDTAKAAVEHTEAELGKSQADVYDAETNANVPVSTATATNTTTTVSNSKSSLSLRANLLR